MQTYGTIPSNGSSTELILPINITSIEPWDDFSRLCAEIIQSTLERQPSCLRSGLKITLVLGGGLLSYLVCVPSFLTAAKFNPFPGASTISSIATMVNFGTFGADQYRELANIIFEDTRKVSGKHSSSVKVCLVATSVVLAALSRLPYAGITLHVAPGIPQQWRVYLAAAGIIGTSSPEAVSTYRTLTLRASKPSPVPLELTEIYLQIVKNNFLHCLKGAKLTLLSARHSLRLTELQKYKRIFLNQASKPRDYYLMADFINSIATQENWQQKHQKNAVKRQRFSVRHLTATATTTAALCSQYNNACLTKLAFDYFAPPPSYDILKWIGAALCTFTLSYTSLLLTYKSAIKTLDSVSALWGNRQHYTFAETYYPASDFIGGVFAYLWAACLYGIIYESTSATVNTSKNYGIALFIGNFAATFLLISYIMKSVIGRGIQLHANSRYAHPQVKEASQVIQKLEEMISLFKDTSASDFAGSLARLHKENLLSAETLKTLSKAYPKYTLKTMFNLEDILNSLKKNFNLKNTEKPNSSFSEETALIDS